MGSSSSDCHVCGKFIPISDFEKRRALILLKRRYCRDCCDAITAGASASTKSSATHRRALQFGGLFARGEGTS